MSRAVPAILVENAHEAVLRYRQAIIVRDSGSSWHHGVPGSEEIRTELAGRDLVCWCPLDAECHADVLLRIANGWGEP